MPDIYEIISTIQWVHYYHRFESLGCNIQRLFLFNLNWSWFDA